MKKVNVSAPGKLMLFGEHAVVYNHPCIVTAVDQRLFLTAEKNDTGDFILEAPDVDILNYRKPLKEIGKGEIPKGAQFIEIALKNVIRDKKISIKGLKITTNSEFKSTFGFGSSSASTVCIVKAMSELYELKLSNRKIFDIAFKTVLDIQGKGSGFDVAAAVFGGTLYFVTRGDVIETLKIKSLPLIIGYSGVKADTVTLINKVSEKFENNKKRLDEIYNSIEKIVVKARELILLQDWKEAGKLMNENQKLLKELGVSIKRLDEMISFSTRAGAYGAKLSGAGGGDCMISFGSEKDTLKIQEEIKKAGGEVINVMANEQGVRIEK